MESQKRLQYVAGMNNHDDIQIIEENNNIDLSMLKQYDAYPLECAILVMDKQYVNEVKKYLNKKFWCKNGQKFKTSIYQNSLIAIHLTHQSAQYYLLDNQNDLIQQMIKKNQISMFKNKRLGSHGFNQLQIQSQILSNLTQKDDSKFTFIELFAGIGGFHLGLSQLYGKCVFSSEINKEAIQTYKLNFQFNPSNDITEIEADNIPQHDILTAGFPCQSFSQAGLKLGFKDERGKLFFEIIRILQSKQPKAFILENVENILNIENGNLFQIIIQNLHQSGYNIHQKIIDHSNVVPQKRKRLYLVGFRTDLLNSFILFKWPQFPQLNRKVSDILEQNVDSKYNVPKAKWDEIVQQGSFQYRICDLQGKARTLISSYKRSYHNQSEFVQQNSNIPRFYTQRECARIQGFKDSFQIPDNENNFYKQIGNAVCPIIVIGIGHQILQALNQDQEKSEDIIESLIDKYLNS